MVGWSRGAPGSFRDASVVRERPTLLTPPLLRNFASPFGLVTRLEFPSADGCRVYAPISVSATRSSRPAVPSSVFFLLSRP